MRTHSRYQHLKDQIIEEKYKAMSPSLRLNSPEDEMQRVLICNVSSFRFINQSKQKMLLDKDTNSHLFKPLYNAFLSGSSSENQSLYPSNNIVVSVNGNNPLNKNSTNSGHSL